MPNGLGTGGKTPSCCVRPGTGNGAGAGAAEVRVGGTRTAEVRGDQMEAGRPPGEAVKSSRASINTVRTRQQTRTTQKQQTAISQRENCMLHAHIHMIISMCMYCPLRQATKSTTLKRACVKSHRGTYQRRRRQRSKKHMVQEGKID